jgi:pyrimidine operon attenuation protein/uracil phosphoribosyltransferase
MTAEEVDAAVHRMAEAFASRISEPRETWALAGIQRRGVPLAKRLAARLAAEGAAPPVGTLDITFYRDDQGASVLDPIVHDTDIPFDMDGRTVILVDDVLYTARTVRCALDELMDFGRPRRVYLAVLVDRGHRELPVQPDFVGKTVTTGPEESVEVLLTETDGEDAVWVSAAKRSRSAGSSA